MGAGDFNLGEFLGIGLDTAQITHLAGALFLGLFAASAVRRVGRASGPWPVVWITVAVGLLAGAALVAARGFQDQIPDELRPWADPDRLVRAATVLCLFGWAIVLLVAHWVRRPRTRFLVRAIGLGAAGLGLWLAAGWFGDQLPDEARPWAAREVVTRILCVAGIVFLAATFWFRPADDVPHARWAARALAVPALALALVLGVRWFGAPVWAELPVPEVIRATVVLAGIGTATCGLIALGAFLLRDRPSRPRPPRRSDVLATEPLPLVADRPLPVAVMLDDRGRPILPTRPSQT